MHIVPDEHQQDTLYMTRLTHHRHCACMIQHASIALRALQPCLLAFVS